MRARICSGIVLMFFGSATAFAQGSLAAQDRILACDPAVAMAAAREILNDPKSLREPTEMFTPALVLFQGGQKDEALFWFYAAQLRARYQIIFQQGGRGQLLQVMVGAVGAPIDNYGLSDTQKMRRTLDRVLEWDARAANPLRDQPQTAEQRERVSRVYAELRQLSEKLAADGPALERQAKQTAYLQAMDNPDRKAQCASGELDPSLVPQESRKEAARVIEWVKNNPQVVRAAGTVKGAWLDSSETPREATMPSHYTISVHGERTIFAEVDVTRSGREAQFSLRCATTVSPGNREAGRDACAR